MSGNSLSLLLGLVLLSHGAAAGAEVSGKTAAVASPPERSMLVYLQRQLADGPRLQIPADAKAVPEWREKVARRLPELLGLQYSVAVPLKARVMAAHQREGYRLEHVAFWSEAGVEVPAYVLIPDGVSAERPAPAVLCLQGMIPGGKDELAGEVDKNAAAAAGLARYHDDFARQFVREGFVTLAMDMRHEGERAHQGTPDPFGLNERLAAIALAHKYATMTGQTFFGLNLFDAIRALDYLETRAEVRKEAMGCAGFSFGATLGTWLAVIDRRVKAVAVEGNLPSWRRLALRGLQDGSHESNNRPVHWMMSATYQPMPGFLREMDLHLTTAAVAPTPMLISYESDLGWVYEDAAEAESDVAPVRQAYAAFGAADKLKIVDVKGGHYWRPEVLVPWLSEELRGLGKTR